MSLALTSAGIGAGYGLTAWASGFTPSGGAGSVTTGPLCAVFAGSHSLISAFTPSGSALYVAASQTDGIAFAGLTAAQTSASEDFACLCTLNNRWFAGLYSSKLVEELNSDGTVKQTITSGFPAPVLGMTPDQVNGWIYVAAANGTIWKVDPNALTKTLWVTAPSGQVDGITLSPDGSMLYYVIGTGGGNLYGLRTDTGAAAYDYIASGGTALTNPDGIGVLGGSLIVNCNDGTVWSIPLSGGAGTQIASGGSRGDFVSPHYNGSLLLSQSDSIYRLSPPCGQTFNTITPSVTAGAVSHFGAGFLYPAGTYRAAYQAGAFRFAPSRGWTVNGDQDIPPPSGRPVGFYLTDEAGHVVPAPGNAQDYATQGACQAGNAGLFVNYTHGGGQPIGIFLNDAPYYDNIAGSPSPTFALFGPVPTATLTASASTIMVGQSSMLTWTSTLAASVALNGTSVALNGSQSVSPAVTTTYLLTATDGCFPYNVTITVTVNQPAPPPNIAALGQCGGAILVSWAAAPYVSGYLVERSADGVSGWTTAGTPAGTSFTDTPPIAGQLYSYRVSGMSGSATSSPSTTASAASILPPPIPTGVNLTPDALSYHVAWTVPDGSYGVLTAALYEGLTPGGEGAVPIAAGLTGGAYTVGNRVNGQPYYVVVTFTNACGTSAAGVETSVTPRCCDDPAVQDAGCATAYAQEDAASGSSVQEASPNNPMTQESGGCGTGYVEG